jgi:hypothetical protein
MLTSLLSSPKLLRRTGVLIPKVILLWAFSLLSAGFGFTSTEAFALVVNPTSLTFTSVQGGTNPAPQSVTFYKKNKREKSWTVSTSGAWISATPSSGTLATETDTIHVSVNTTGLTAGSYSGQVTIAVAQRDGRLINNHVSVTLTVTAGGASPTIGVSPTSLSFSGTAGGTNPPSKSVNITNIGGGTLSWNAGDNAAWLSVSPTAGTNGGSTTVAVNLSGLAAGTYTTAIIVAAAGATNTPQVIPVTLTVASPTSASPTTSSATLTWNANTETDLAGYKVYRGTSPGTYGAPIATLQGNVTNYVATGLQLGMTYYFAVTAYDTAGNESVYSNEVSKSVY